MYMEPLRFEMWQKTASQQLPGRFSGELKAESF
jgi:hypothetical protein